MTSSSATTLTRTTELIDLGRAEERLGRFRDAAVAYSAALAAESTAPLAALGLVRVLDRLGERREAQAVLRRFVAAAQSTASIVAAARQWEAWQDTPVEGATTVRVALIGSDTLAPLATHLRVACGQAGLHPIVSVGSYGQWAQDILADDSPLYGFSPEIVILSLGAPTLFPETMANPEADENTLSAERANGLARIAALLDRLGERRPGVSIILSTFSVPDRSPFGAMDLKQPNGQHARMEALNSSLIDLARHRPDVLLLDQDRVEARHGKARVRDERLWYLASSPYSDSFLPVLAAEYVRIIRPLKGLVRKAIVLDLDETLWGGVIGEAGIDGVSLGGNDAPGNAYYDFQRALNALRRRGILLALCSKNNPDEAWGAIDEHPHMVLRRQHFAAARINWTDKATNIRSIARELNLGLDSLVFIDDNPAERALIREQLPEVLTVELPKEPAYFTRTLLDLDVFETIALTTEDRRRSGMYAEAEARRQFEESRPYSGHLTEHLGSLSMKVRIDLASAFTLPRIAQLVNKTNQFNLTTRRYTQAQIRAMAADEEAWSVISVTVADRFGDLGLTGVAIVRTGSEVWTIDSFLLSCRVLGRGIEDVLLSHIAQRAHDAGARTLRGTYIPTKKNEPARSFYPDHGFSVVSGGTDEAVDFELVLAGTRPRMPKWLEVVEYDAPR
jgi:FkbH-like protein